MSWLRSLFGGRRPSRPSPQPPTSRPRLEGLEERITPNVSVAYSAQGAVVQLAVYDNGTLVQYDSSGAHLLVDPAAGGPGVRVAHAFRDFAGNVGMDVVYFGGMAFEYDSNGGHFMGSNILNLSRAYAPNGDFRLEVLYNDGSGFTGNLVEFSPTNVQLLGKGVRFATAYLDANGQFGLAVGFVDVVANATVIMADSISVQALYNGSFVITQSIGDVDRTFDPNGNLVLNLVFNPGNAGGGSLGSPHTGREYTAEAVIGQGFNVMAN
jgi:hypothetical protein